MDFVFQTTQWEEEAVMCCHKELYIWDDLKTTVTLKMMKYPCRSVLIILNCSSRVFALRWWPARATGGECCYLGRFCIVFLPSCILIFSPHRHNHTKSRKLPRGQRGGKKQTGHPQLLITCNSKHKGCIKRQRDTRPPSTSHSLLTDCLPLSIFTVILLQIAKFRNNLRKIQGVFKSTLRHSTALRFYLPASSRNVFSPCIMLLFCVYYIFWWIAGSLLTSIETGPRIKVEKGTERERKTVPKLTVTAKAEQVDSTLLLASLLLQLCLVSLGCCPAKRNAA